MIDGKRDRRLEMMKGKISSNFLAYAALASIFTINAITAAAMPPAGSGSNRNPTDSNKCTVYYMPPGNFFNIPGLVKPVEVPLDEDNRGYHAFDTPVTVMLAFAPDCPAEVTCLFEINNGVSKSGPFSGNRILQRPIKKVTAVECVPLTDFEGNEDGNGGDGSMEGEVRDDVYVDQSQRQTIVRMVEVGNARKYD